MVDDTILSNALASLHTALSEAIECRERAQRAFLVSALVLADERINGGEDADLLRGLLRDFDSGFLALEMAQGACAQAQREVEMREGGQVEPGEEITA